VDDYEFIDAGDGRRLERFGKHVVDRPQAGATHRPYAPDRWTDADLRFDRGSGWSGTDLADARNGWVVRLADLALELRPTDAGQVGLFPEHAAMLPWLRHRVAERPDTPGVLHLFASTGLVTLALAMAGAAVVHVDAARPAVAWARRNAVLNGLDDRPIRWLVDDAHAFVKREMRRDRRFDGVVLDPPTYGHGASGKAWRIETHLAPLISDIRTLTAPDGFILLTAHTESIRQGDLGGYLGDAGDAGKAIETGELRLSATSGATLRLGAYARWRGAS
jgi:23S rRNA (cytosine1962-C5)-methyltransferase